MEKDKEAQQIKPGIMGGTELVKTVELLKSAGIPKSDLYETLVMQQLEPGAMDSYWLIITTGINIGFGA